MVDSLSLGNTPRQLLFQVSGVGINIFFGQTALLALEGFTFTAEAGATAGLQDILQGLNELCLFLILANQLVIALLKFGDQRECLST